MPDEETPPGVTISADGYYQNSNGEYVDATGKKVDEPVKAKSSQAAPPAKAPAKTDK